MAAPATGLSKPALRKQQGKHIEDRSLFLIDEARSYSIGLRVRVSEKGIKISRDREGQEEGRQTSVGNGLGEWNSFGCILNV